MFFCLICLKMGYIRNNIHNPEQTEHTEYGESVFHIQIGLHRKEGHSIVQGGSQTGCDATGPLDRFALITLTKDDWPKASHLKGNDSLRNIHGIGPAPTLVKNAKEKNMIIAK